MKKKFIVLSIIMIMSLMACGKKETSSEIIDEEYLADAIQEEVDPVEGHWIANGVIYEGQFVSFDQNEGLRDLYDTQWITIDGNGEFSYQNHVFTHNGTWKKMETEENEHSYIFEQKTTSKMQIEDDSYEMVEEESEKVYLGMLTGDDLSALVFFEKGSSEDDIILVYFKDGESVEYNSDNNIDSSEEYTYEDDDYEENYDSYSVSSGEENALRRAKEYLEYSAFSYSGLIEQLEFEGFSNSEATYGADHCGADWNEQAVKRAEEYLEYSAFSYSGLIEQLEFEGFTSSQAEYGASVAY